MSKQGPKLSLYYSDLCYFCQKVRRSMQGMQHVAVDLRDVMDAPNNKALVQGGGKSQVPCLLIEQDGQQRWLYESDDIINYLRNL